MEQNPDNVGKPSASSEIKASSLRQVTRQGDTIKYVQSENLTTIKKESAKKDSKLTSDSVVDQIASGESLYKTLSFESNKDETQKCIAFWKSVVEKKLIPIKCTIIENIDSRQEGNANTVEKKPLSTPKAQEKTSPEQVNWRKLFVDLQKKRLDEVKLIGKKRCGFCEAPSKGDESTTKKTLKSEIKQEVKALDSWQPNSIGPLNLKQSSLSSKLKMKSSSLKGTEDIQKPKQPTITDSKMEAIKVESQKYQLVDVIGEKKKNGEYSKWRDNKIKAQCPCKKVDCDCNTNPAITSVDIKEDLASSSESPKEGSDYSEKFTKQTGNSLIELAGLTKLGEAESMKSSILVDLNQINDTPRHTNMETHSKRMIHKSLSVKLDCTCDSEECDCLNIVQVLSRTKISLDKQDDMPVPIPQKKHRVERTDSIEVLRKRLSRHSIS